MDRTYDGPPLGSATLSSNAPRKSSDTGRLQRKKSRTRVQSENYAGPQTHNRVEVTAGDGYAGGSGQAGQRKGSLRNAMRKIFGRRSRESPAPPVLERTPPRHQHNRSEPPNFSPHLEQLNEERSSSPQRALSTPLRVDVGPSFPRLRSPYALEFPKSATLKPYQLGTPFDAPGSALRRRKTLPSILLGDGTEAGPSSAPPVPARPSESRDETPDVEPGLAIRNPNRRSRSASDLRAQAPATVPDRKRSDEIRFWRESFTGSVLRTSGFTVPPRLSADTASAREAPPLPTPVVPTTPPSRPVTQPASGHARNASNLSASSPLRASLSQDLEERVASLEANLLAFRRSLQRLQADKNRRAAVISPVDSVRGEDNARDEPRARTASMLIDDLQYPFARSREEGRQSQYQDRPRTAPGGSPPRDLGEVPPLPLSSRDSLLTPTHAPAASARRPSPSTTPQVTFRSLYQMLSDERSARRNLENQVRGLRTEVQDLQREVSSSIVGMGSGVQSQRASYIMMGSGSGQPSMNPEGSRRLADLLRETDDVDEDVYDDRHATQKPDRIITALRREDDHSRVVSRFSGSTTGQQSHDDDDVAGGAPVEEMPSLGYDKPGYGATSGYREAGDDEELQTPHEAYITPTEGRAAGGRGFDFELGSEGDDEREIQSRRRRRGEGEMF
nr:hypothetical protein B0A51_07781 [Rachicladosporium sp. CCFEE 5018]OQO25099.1 hypothetical protein B0A51_07421 [Rachicladosporium sp. CCFEE 5018]